jgi:WD40 repeat protein
MTYTWSFGSHRFGQAQAWSVTDGQRIGTFNSAQDGIVHAVSFSPDGTKLAVAGGNAVRIWAVRQARIVQILQGHEAYSVAFSYDGQMLVSGGEASGHQPRPSGIAPDEPNLLLWRIKP